MKNMPIAKKELKQIKDTVVEAVDPYFTAVQKDFSNVYERFDMVDERLEKIEKLILADHKRRIEKLETEVKELRELLAIK